ncbi:HET-domain-containing protein [Trematosphaeria pertusa]|uniref:HET-domain-containing protein n=1 Tax=Trematosphaeria pertusa TaxID=390896 RepID=A0A6A6I0V3_9PLEO|nr:HET-domain-containing protein [Trematosphaeria pertusa]KAF2243533.1 HET-domain-containing protein [Trematosphaeria pertusa]
MSIGGSFQYSPIDPAEREIRLLTIIPQDSHEKISCRLSKTSLTYGIFDALSYVWGGEPSSFPNTILLDGAEFSVTRNLELALRGLRLPKGSTPKPLWVDAVCINQKDIIERNQQVGLMGEIYSSADRVIIWLGEADKDSDVALDTVPLLANEGLRHKDENDRNEADRKQQIDRYQRCGSFFFGLPDQRPWLSRVWILQELALAKNDPLVVCGTKMVLWSTLIRGWKAIAREIFTGMQFARPKTQKETSPETYASDLGSEDEGDVEILAAVKLDLLDDLRCEMRKEGGGTLRRLLLFSRTSQATDPRDRVYALLSLVKPSETVVVADYRKPCAAVYADAMSNIFSAGEGLYFLSGVFLPGIGSKAPYIPSLPPTIEQPPLPSWVPDFCRQTGELADQPSGITFHPPDGISASGAGSGCMNGKVLDDNRTLQVEGLVIDTIDHVVPMAQDLDQFISQLPSLEATVADAKERLELFDTSIAPLVRQFKTKEPLWKILVSNKRLSSGYDAAPAAYENMHLELLKQDGPSATSKTDQGATDTEPSEYAMCLKRELNAKSVFTTTSGFCGTCVPDAREGDVVVILFGPPVPFVLRPVPQDAGENTGPRRSNHYLIGAAYVGGIMNGEMVDELYCEDLMDSTTFFLQ